MTCEYVVMLIFSVQIILIIHKEKNNEFCFNLCVVTII